MQSIFISIRFINCMIKKFWALIFLIFVQSKLCHCDFMLLLNTLKKSFIQLKSYSYWAFIRPYSVHHPTRWRLRQWFITWHAKETVPSQIFKEFSLFYFSKYILQWFNVSKLWYLTLSRFLSNYFHAFQITPRIWIQ